MTTKDLEKLMSDFNIKVNRLPSNILSLSQKQKMDLIAIAAAEITRCAISIGRELDIKDSQDVGRFFNMIKLLIDYILENIPQQTPEEVKEMFTATIYYLIRHHHNCPGNFKVSNN